ncbi:MAG: DUF5713 family protein [Flavobacteriales bacterium]
MRILLSIVAIVLLASCSRNSSAQNIDVSKTDVENEFIRKHDFLLAMYSDSYFPSHLVKKAESTLLKLCYRIESQNIKSLEDFYFLTHQTTKEFNELQNVFIENGSELETVARESIAMEFTFIAESYGFDADLEYMIAPRDW